MIAFFNIHFSIPYHIRLLRPFWAVMTPVRTVMASKQYLRLRLRHPRNRRPTVDVRPTPVTVRRAPLRRTSLSHISKLEPWKILYSDVLAWPESQRPGQAAQYRPSQSQATSLASLGPWLWLGIFQAKNLGSGHGFWPTFNRIFWAPPDVPSRRTK